MKKNNLLKTLLGFSVVLGVFAATVGGAKEAVNAAASDFSATEVNVSGKTTWKASDGTMLSIPHWKNSGLGLSVEFQVNIPDGGLDNSNVMHFYSGDTKIASTNVYLFDRPSGKFTVDNFSSNRNPEHLSLIDKTNKWFRFDVMFADITAIAGQEDATFDNVRFVWYGSAVTKIRNMRLISEIRTTYINETPVEYTKTASGAPYLKGGYNEFVKVANWKNSGLGFSFEFKPTQNNDSLLQLMNNSYNEVTTGNNYWFRKNGASNGIVGKLTKLSNDWYRYELMFADIACASGKENETVAIIAFNKWEASGYNCKPTFRNVKQISAYSSVAEGAADTWATNFLSATGDVCQANGQTEVLTLKNAWDAQNTSFAALSAQAKIALLYTDRVDVTKKANLDGAVERYSYIAAKYPTLGNALYLNVANANTANNFAIVSNESFAVVIVSLVAISSIGILVFLKKRRANR